MLRRHLRNPNNRCILHPVGWKCDGVWRRNQNIPRESDTIARGALPDIVSTSLPTSRCNVVGQLTQVGTMSRRVRRVSPRERISELRLCKESCDDTSTRAEYAAPYRVPVTSRQRCQRGEILSVVSPYMGACDPIHTMTHTS